MYHCGQMDNICLNGYCKNMLKAKSLLIISHFPLGILPFLIVLVQNYIEVSANCVASWSLLFI